MIVYADSSVLASSYLPDSRTVEAKKLMTNLKNPLLLSNLSILEIENAFRLRLFRSELTAQTAYNLKLRLNSELAQGWFILKSDKEPEAWQRARELSLKYTENLGTRSLDIWHVAFAQVHGAQNFLSFDHRQIKLAKAVGLFVNVVNLRK